jgi:hypothetical protein
MLVDADNIINRRQPRFQNFVLSKRRRRSRCARGGSLHEDTAPDWLYHARSPEKCLLLGGWAQFQLRRPQRPSVR